MKKTIVKSVIIAVLFFVVTAAYGLIVPKLWNSPDETAVAFFSSIFAHNGHLWAMDGLNVFGNDIVHPRSIVSIMAALVPASFYGQMIVTGIFMKAVGTAAFSLTTPFFTAIAGVSLFFFLRKRGELAGLIGQAIFYLTPAVWYFASRGLFPNLLFCDLALIGISFIYFHPFLKLGAGRGSEFLERQIDAALGGLFIGLAFIVRPVEFIWFAPLGLAALWLTRKNYWKIEALSGVLVFSLMVSVILVLNNALYGSPFAFGYTAGAITPGVSVPALAATSHLPGWLSAPRPFILPFGFHPKLAITNLFDYLVWFTPWFALTAAWGFVVLALKKGERRYARFLGAAGAWIAVVIGVYYASGSLNDPTVPGLSIGSSYVRYFLPLYIILIPAVTEGIVFFARLIKNKKFIGNFIVGFVLFAFAVLGAWTVYFRTPESLMPVYKTLSHYAEVKAQVLAIVKPGDVIITERSDKIFFPDRRVVLNLRDAVTLKQLPRLMVGAGLYYYGIAIKDDEYAKLQTELGTYKLQLGRIKAFGNEMLYGITRE